MVPERVEKDAAEEDRDLLHLLLEQEGIDAAPSTPAPLSGPRETAPLSSPQKRLWFLDRLQPGSDFYSVLLTFELRGDLDVALLERAFREIARRHGAFRTRFILHEGEPVQKVERDAEIRFPVVDLRDKDAEEKKDRVREILTEPGRQVFDLSQCPLLRGVLIRLDTQEYLLGLSVHHIVFDEWSLGILQHESAVLYTAYARGEESPLKEVPQYVDYTLWQQEWMKGELSGRQLEYWKNQLMGMPAVLELATDRPRPPMPRCRDHVESVALSPRLWEDLKRVSRREGATLFMTLLAAYQVLLLRYTGQSDFGVGTPVANRNHLKAEELVGFCVNTVVMRAALGDGPSFREALNRAKKTAFEGFGHQDLPLERLVEVLAPERDLSHTPLFQVMFTMRNELRSRYHLAQVSMDLTQVEAATLCDLVLIASDFQGPTLGLNYNPDLFDAGTVERMLCNFVRLLEGIIAGPGQRVWDLPLLSEMEVKQLCAWNQTRTDYPRDKSLVDLFEEQAARRGDEPAVAFGKDQLSYRELNERTNQLGRYLRKLGVGPETLVGVSTERSIEMVVGILGILKAGAAYVPIDPGYPPDRLTFMVTDAALRVLLTQEKLLRQLPSMDVRLLCLDRDWKEIAQENPGPLPAAAGAENIVYVIYTSGSTGEPKGVAVTHRSMIRLVRNTNYLQFTGNETVAQCTNASFDPVTFELWGSLLNGGRLVIIAHDTLLDSRKLAEEIRRQGIQVMFLATALFNELAKRNPEVFATVEHLTFGGEAANVGAAAAVLEHSAPRRLVHLYGPAECTTFSSWYLAKHIDKDAPSVPIGAPVANTQLYVLDKEMNRLPVGVAGELYIGGEGVARGYWRRPAMTAEKFLPDPFGGRAGATFYRSGDRARFLPSGDLEFLGRFDNQIKIRGFRVELGEIETALRQCPGVRECAVVLREDGATGKRLAAFVAGEAAVDQLRGQMKARLPEYMVPVSFTILPELPLNTNGKVDRIALLGLQGAGESEKDIYVAPRNPIEARAAEIWAGVLGREKVGIHDNFFRLGGHSLLATSMIARLQQEFGVDLGVRSLFESPTIAQQAELISARLPQGDQSGTGSTAVAPAASACNGTPAQRPSVFPLSYAQERLWFLDRLQPGSRFYNVPLALELTGELDVACLECSLQHIIRRHETLRTSFCMENGEPRQKIEASVEFRLPLMDLTGLPKDEREKRAALILAEEGDRAFDLGRGPLLHAVLLRTAERMHILGLTMHHIVCDDWSLGVLWRELGAFYEVYRKNETPAARDLPMQYSDFALWQRQWLQGERFEKQLDYWKKQLAGMPGVLDLATDFPRPAIQNFCGRTETRELPAALWQSLNAMGRRENVTTFMVLLAAFQVLLLRYTEQEDFGIGSAMANRARIEEEGLIGFFVNTLVMRARLAGRPNFREVLRRVREMSLGAYAHQDLPFEKLVEELVPDRDVSRTPVFQVMFTLRSDVTEQCAFGGLQLKPVEVPLNASKCDLVFMVEEDGKSTALAANYNTDLFSRATMRRMLEHYERLLESILADTGQPVLALPMLTQTEEKQLVMWNQTKVALPRGSMIDLFESQAEDRLDQLAVTQGETSLTYAELNRRANQLARYLKTLVLGPEAVVGLCLERSLEMVVAMLGIMKAGGAYLPLDPLYPAERLRTLAEDAGVAVVLTTQSHRNRLPQEMRARVVPLDLAAEIIAQQSTVDLAHAIVSESLACVVPAPGQSGTNLVMVQHCNLVNQVTWRMQTHHLGPDDRVSQAAAISSDVCSMEIWPCLASGASLHIADQQTCTSPAQLGLWMRQQGITISFLATPLASDVLAWMNANPGGSKLRLLFAGSDPLARLPGPGFEFEVVNGYGLPECAGLATSAVVSPGAQLSALAGRPVANTEVYILDQYFQRAAVGVPGELWIAGAGLARGFLHRADLTALQFRPDPFAKEPGARMVRGPARARWRDDGHLELIDSAESQILTQGLVVQLDEVESAIEQHSSVKQAIVAARSPRDGDRHLVAYVVVRPGQSFDSSELRNHLERLLPSHMVPRAFVTLPALPLNVRGAVDRRALASLGDAQISNQPAPPRTELEQTIAAAWQELLGLDKISVHDNFFDSGGHSLMIIRLHEKLCAALNLEIELMHLFQFPTIDSLSRFLQAGYNFKGKSRGLAERAGRQKNAIQSFRRMQTV